MFNTNIKLFSQLGFFTVALFSFSVIFPVHAQPTTNPDLSVSTLAQFDQFQNDTKTHTQHIADDTRRKLTGDNTETRRYSIVLRATLTDTQGNDVTLQVELKKIDQSFDGTTNLHTSTPVSSGTIAEVTLKTSPHPDAPLTEGAYKWRARTLTGEGDTQTQSEWTEYGNTNPDFTINHTYKVGIIMAEVEGSSKETAPVPAPCKLAPYTSKSYPNGYTGEYYNDLSHCLNDYMQEVSMGAVTLDTDILAHSSNDGWVSVTKTLEDGNASETQLVTDAINAFEDGNAEFDASNYDVIYVVHTGEARQETRNQSDFATKTWPQLSQPNIIFPYKIIINYTFGVQEFAHELTHIMGGYVTPEKIFASDLYLMGFNDRFFNLLTKNLGWALMGKSSGNSGGKNPPHPSTYTKEFLGWLTESPVARSAVGSYIVKALPQLQFGESATRFNLTDTGDEYYLFETRNSDLAEETDMVNWDADLPKDGGQLLAYKVKTNGHEEYDWSGTNPIEKQHDRIINIADIIPDDQSFYIYRDMWNELSITQEGTTEANGDYVARVNIENTAFADFRQKFTGALMDGSSSLWSQAKEVMLSDSYYLPMAPAPDTIGRYAQEKMTYQFCKPIIDGNIDSCQSIVSAIETIIFTGIFVIAIRWTLKRKSRMRKWAIVVLFSLIYANTIAAIVLAHIYEYDSSPEVRFECRDAYCAPTPQTLPDLDLHATLPDGTHIGMNYETGEFENPIPEAIVSGDLTNDTEWIYLPDTDQYRGTQYSVSPHDTQQFLQEHPEIANSLTDTQKTESYTLYAEHIDPEEGFFRSDGTDYDITPDQTNDHTINLTDSHNPLIDVEDEEETQPTILTPTDDINTGGDLPNQLAISKWNHAFLRFDATNQSPVENATLRVYHTNDNLPITLYAGKGDNDEVYEGGAQPTITYIHTDPALRIAETSVQAEGYTELDITDYVNAQIASDGIVTIELSSNGDTWSRISDRQGTHPPELVLDGEAEEDEDEDDEDDDDTQPITLTPTDDINTGGDLPNQLAISKWNHAFLRFDATNQTPVEHATLRVYHTNDNLPITLYAGKGDNDEVYEGGSQPSITYIHTDASLRIAEAPVSAEGYTDLDITDYVNAQIASDGIITIELSSDGDTWSRISDRQGTHSPELVLE